jgi:hypothetical protein
MAPGTGVGRKQELVWDGDVERNTATAGRRRLSWSGTDALPPKALEGIGGGVKCPAVACFASSSSCPPARSRDYSPT